MYKYLPSRQLVYIICSFFAGFALMTVELLSSRIVAPIIGNSIYTWTSLIGMTLLGLAIGSVVGGILADKYDNNKILPLSLLISAISVFTISPLSTQTEWIVNISNSIIFINLIIAGYLFLIPAIAIGLIQPIILKKYATDFSKIGFKYGLLSTIWSLGSILGVFITGFYFISNIGSLKTIFIIGFLLLFLGSVVSILNREKKTLELLLLCLIIFIFFFVSSKPAVKSNIIFNQESNYYKIRVVDFNQEPYGETRALLLDFDTHSVEFQKIMQSKYTEIYPAFKAFNSNLKNILIIGGGAYTLPKLLKNYYPEANISVIEIDPAVEKTANLFFKLDSSKIKTIIGDARFIINKNNSKYDLIYGDAYNSFISVPGWLLTKEFNEKIKNSLNENGIYSLNFISSLTGENTALFQSLTNTFISSFPNYYIFAFGDNHLQTQSITLVGINGSIHPSESDMREALFKGDNSFLAKKLIVYPELYLDNTATILTDDFHPTEKLMLSSINKYFPNFSSFMREIL